jgi:hypothetical protein
MQKAFLFCQVGSQKTHRRFLARNDGTYGPMPRGKPKGLLAMAFTALATAVFLGKVSSLWHFQGSCVLIELLQTLVSSVSFTPF